MGQGLEGPGVVEEEPNMKQENSQLVVNYIKKNPQISLFSSILHSCMQHEKQQTGSEVHCCPA